jgi:hypothetical protein
MCLTLIEELGSKVGPSLLGQNRPFSTLAKNKGLKPHKNTVVDHTSKQTIQPNKGGTHLEPNSSRLGTCQGWNLFTLGNQTPFQNQRFQTRLTLYTTTDTKASWFQF